MQKNSTYNKIWDIINAASENPTGIAEFAELIQEASESFVYYRRGADGTVRSEPCSLATIRRQIRFCVDLGLVENEETCNLTPLGRNALDHSRFGLVLQQAVLGFLERSDLPWIRIESAISKLHYPGPFQLYVELSPSMSEDLFRTCLFLLSQCGEELDQNVLDSLVMKIYLTEEKARDVRRV
jgi:hypothetical protein